MPNVSEYLFAQVAEAGIEHVFLLPGGGCMHLVDALAREDRLVPVALLHEQAVGVAAEAYGQARNGPGVALVTTGPGGTNALTAVAAAWLDSTPVLFVSGQVKSEDLVAGRGIRQYGFQEIDIVSMTKPITKNSILLLNPAEAPAVIRRALALTVEGRPGPVWIDIPLDVQAMEIPPEALRSTGGQPRVVMNSAPFTDDIEVIVKLLAEAERPLILAGNGIRLSGAIQDLLSFARQRGIPIATTWKAMDFLAEDDPLFAGRPGAIASRYANFAQQTSDLLLCIGARLDLGQTGYRHDTFGPGATRIVVDIDPNELAKLSFPGGRFICSDAGAFLRRLEASVPVRGRESWGGWRSRIDGWRSRFPLFLDEEREWSDGISVYALMDILSDLMSPDYLFVPGSSGACSEVSMQSFKVKSGQRVFNSEGLGPMGFGIPAAIGACLATGGRPTVCIDGDGGFAMNLQELASVRRLGLPIRFIVLDNDGYGSIKTSQDAYFNGRRVAADPDSGLELPDYASVGPAMGIDTCVVRSFSELRDRLPTFLGSQTPQLMVAKVSPRQVTRPRISSRRNKDGKMVSDPLHDLSPKLSSDELSAELHF